MTDDVPWQELYQAAMLELDHASLQMRIEAARAAIRQVMEELTGKDGNGQEVQAMAEALRNLQILQRLELENINTSRQPSPALGEG